MIDFKCKCGQKIKVDDEHAGKSGKCPKCKQIIEIPLPAIADSEQEIIDAPLKLKQQTKACAYCGEEILEIAKKCKHCGEFLINSNSGGESPQSYEKKVVPVFSKFTRGLIIFTVGLFVVFGSIIHFSTDAKEEELYQKLKGYWMFSDGSGPYYYFVEESRLIDQIKLRRDPYNHENRIIDYEDSSRDYDEIYGIDKAEGKRIHYRDKYKKGVFYIEFINQDTIHFSEDERTMYRKK